MTGLPPDDATTTTMAKRAWLVRERSYLIGTTAVGATVLTVAGAMFDGCNVEHRYRCHDVHAEVNAITGMVAAGSTEIAAILIAAERQKFTPCGGCMDWIFQFGGPDAWVGYQNTRNGRVAWHRARELMPHYPE